MDSHVPGIGFSLRGRKKDSQNARPSSDSWRTRLESPFDDVICNAILIVIIEYASSPTRIVFPVDVSLVTLKTSHSQ